MLPFENLSGDPALDRWRNPLQRAFQAMSGARVSSASKDAAILSGASFLAYGSMERVPASGQIQVSVEFFDAESHRLVQSASAQAPDPFDAISKLAKVVSPQASALGSVSAGGMGLWVDVLNAQSPSEWTDSCRKLLEAEPAFGPAYSSCGDAPLTEAERAAAGERGFTHRKAFRPEEQVSVGQFLFQTGRFQQAVEALTAVAPAIPAAWNSVGYAQAALGNLAEAKKALEEYRKLGGDEPNAVDSLGETHYMAGKYAEAERFFLECAEKFPQSPQGRVAKLKAASMRALQGNRGGAEELARELFDKMKKAGQDSKPIEELWRGIILEQDVKVMREKIENGGILVPPGRPRRP